MPKIQFEVSNTATGSVAVDDVQVYDGSCPNTEEVCGFEDGNICGYDIGKWSVGTAKQLASTTGLLTDLTTSTEEGHYIHLDATVQATASLVSPMYQPTPGRCLKFYYHVKDNIENTFALDVFLRNEGGNSYLIDRLARGDNSSIWSFGEVNIFSGKYFQIVFASTNHGGVISLDDIQLSSSACPDSYGCDFEQGMCAWRPSVEHRTNLDWQITSGHLPEGNIGPLKDVTLNNQFGHFLFLQTSAPAQPGDLAVLISQEMYTGGCLTFYYSMMADGTGDLNILIKILDGVSQPTRLWSKSGSQGSRPEWRRAIVTLQVPADKLDKPFQLFIEGVVGTTPGADIAVDEIKVHDTVCSNVRDDDTLMIDCKQTSGSKSKTQVKRSQICDFIKDCPQGEDEENCGSCQFSHQNEWCNYVDVSQGEVLWKHSMEVSDLLKAAIPQRPRDSFDKRHGGFLLVDREKSPYAGSMVADLEIDHFLGPSPPACQLHFSYFNSRMMNFIPLKVLLRQSDEETVIYRVQTWSYSWSSVSVDIGSIDSRFKIAFLGYKIFGRTDEVLVAIDDIEFRNCEFPSVVASCKDSEFRCARGSCVDVTRVCDFTDDCGDGSDENGCGSQPVLLRTSFEDGFGDWTVGDNKVTTPWLIKDGRSGQDLDSHPGRDHTLGTLTGHFMYYERHMGNPARLISPILESKPGGEKCHLRLFYFIMGSNDPNGLHVYIKTTNWDSSKPVFSKFTSHGQVWTRADIEIQETGKPFQIVIEGQDGEYGSFLGVDDISVWNCNTSSDLALPDGGSVYRPPCNLYEFQCGDNTCIPIGKLCNFQEDCKDGSDENHCGSCDFESDMCGWQDESLGIYSWTQRGSFQLPQPFRDATSQVDGSGHFVQLQTHGAGVDKVDALLLSPLLKETDPGCQLSFSYFTNVAATDENLRISVQESYQAGTENYLDIPQAKTVTAEPGQWTRMTYSLGMSPGYSRVIIRYEFRKLSDSAIIAVDDIDFENCKPRVGIKSIARSTAPLECTFSENLCQFHPNYLKSNFPWTLGEGLGHRGQRTKFAEAGSWSGSQPGHTATLTSNWIYETNTDLCVKFWYQTFGTTVKVKVLQNSHGREYNPAFSHHSYDFTWRLGFANIPATDKPFFIEIQAVSGSHSEVAHLSDITVTKHSCPRDGSSCDFEIDTCGFTLDKTKGWSRMMKATKGSVLTPSQDHTTGDAYGSFMNVAERQDLGEQSVEMVSVERDQPADQDSCTVFWYHLRGPDAGRLKVKLRTSGSRADRLVWTMGGEQGDHWMQGRVNVPRDIGKYRLVFEAELTGGRMGSIAVDDIKQEKGACPSEGTCDFDIDMCGYTSHTYSENSDVETESRWLRLTSKLHISPYAPSAEHTQKHLNGGYAASDQFSYVAFDREPMAKLVSPYLDSTSKSCVSFWYHFDGSAEGSLRVLIGSVELFKINTKFKDWRYSGIIEYSSHSPYQITFQSERKGRGKGLIAVDDILVNDCEEVKTQTVRPTAKTTEAPRPSVIAHLPVPDKGDTDHYFKTNCNAYCVHFASCHHIGKTYVDCKCQKGYRGRRCDIAEPPETPALQRPDSSVHKDTREREHETVEAAKPKANQSDEKQESNGWKVALGVVVTIIVLLVLAFAAFLFMVRTNRLQVPRQLENLLPSFLAPRDVGGGDNPIYSYTSDNGEGILNPVYDPEKTMAKEYSTLSMTRKRILNQSLKDSNDWFW
ncbi:hypothetical protein RRG08_048232 [Elysia crispata]|uniref:Apical endosomal glycoprotein n=1 Tax=Elysia crispata TaxID=231223 RepID=A0AAE0XZ49_9GAST|nr:hypothetical protein RRG08_048232 [Elysia crispata]